MPSSSSVNQEPGSEGVDGAIGAVHIAANRAAVRALVGRWVVHDLRGPIQGMALVGDMLAQSERPIEASMRHTLRENARRSRELLDVLAKLLALAAPEPVVEPVALGTVLDTVVSIHRCYRGRIRLAIDRAAVGELPAVRASSDGLLHVLLNLTVNALTAQRAQPDGSIAIAGTVTADGTAVVLAIEDAGPGLPAAVREALDGPPDAAASPGLGLPVTRALLDRWGGTLAACPPTGPGGTRLVVTLPTWAG